MEEKIYYEIVQFDRSGVTLKNKKENIYIPFAECAKNFANENSLKTSKCVATRDITKNMFTFYTIPKTKLVFQKRFLKDIFTGKSSVKRFSELQKTIKKCGYTSYDLS